MRRIYIDDKVREVAQYYKDHLFEKHTRRDFILPKKGLESFETEIMAGRADCPLWRHYANYVKELRTHFEEIILLKPSSFKIWYHRYFDRLNEKMLTDKTWRNRVGDMSFSDHIVRIMHYATVRSEDMVTCVKKLGIKTCVYCNSQYTATVIIDEKETKGAYELDHFYPKEKYPFLCISFYNLQPSCSSCNKWKSKNDAEFGLYTEKYQDLDPFTFRLTPASIVMYMLNQRAESLDVRLESQDTKLLANHLERFHTNELYYSFNDEIERLIWLKKSFNEAFKNQLVPQFKKLFPQHATRNDIIRFLYGFYANPKDVHKRPLTKVKQDVARQLGMI